LGQNVTLIKIGTECQLIFQAINVSGGKGNGGLNVQGNKLASPAIPAAVRNS